MSNLFFLHFNNEKRSFIMLLKSPCVFKTAGHENSLCIEFLKPVMYFLLFYFTLWHARLVEMLRYFVPWIVFNISTWHALLYMFFVYFSVSFEYIPSWPQTSSSSLLRINGRYIILFHLTVHILANFIIPLQTKCWMVQRNPPIHQSVHVL